MKKSNNLKILFIGDVNVDLIFGGLKHPVQEDKEVLADRFSRTIGSSAVITAVAYKSLGGHADVCGLVGNDDNGRYMLGSMKKLGIGISLVQVDKNIPTGITVNLIYGHARSQVTYPGTISIFSGPKLSTALSNYAHIHFSGIYQQKSFLPNLVKNVKYVKKLGLNVSLDTQWDAEEKWEHLNELYPYLDYLFVNEDEALSISRTENVESALNYFEKKASCTLIKLGSEGACFYKNSEVKKILPYPAKVVDTIGAGDAFAGGFLYAVYIRKLDIYHAIQYASAVAARNCEFPGGVGAKSTDSDIQKKLKEK